MRDKTVKPNTPTKTTTMVIATCEVQVEIYLETKEWVDDDGVQYYWPNQMNFRMLASEKKVVARKKPDPLTDDQGNTDELYVDEKQVRKLIPTIESHNRMKIKLAMATKGLGVHKLKLKLLVDESQVKLH